MRGIFAIVLLAALLGVAHAQPTRIQSVEIVEAGIFQAEVTKTVRTPGTATGDRKEVTNIRLIEATTNIPAKIGVEFGFRYKVVGRPNGARITLMRINRFPQPGLQNPATGNTIVREDYPVDVTLGETSYIGYRFDNDWEVVPGTWTFEIWNGDEKIAVQTFEVVKP